MGGRGKDSRCMLRAGREMDGLLGEREGADVLGGANRRPLTVTRLGDVALAGFASDRLRPCLVFSSLLLYCLFGRLAELDRTSDTVASFILRSDAKGLLPLLPVSRRSDGRDGDGDGDGNRNVVDDSSSSRSTALSSTMISRSSGDRSPRLVTTFMARRNGEIGGEGPSVSFERAMTGEGMTRRDGTKSVCNKYKGLRSRR